MRIAFIVNTFPNLSETFILNQITGLIDLGHHVEIFAKPTPTGQKSHSNVQKYNLTSLTHYHESIPSNKTQCRLKALCLLASSFLKNPLKTSKTLIRMLRSKDPFLYSTLFLALKIAQGNFDILHCHYGPNGNIGVKIKKLGIYPALITTFHGYDANCYPLQAGPNVYSELFQTGDLYTANTNFTADQVENLGCDRTKIKVLPVGLQIDKFDYSPRTFPELGPIKILTVARLVEKKGHQYALKAIAEIAKKHPNIKFLIAGDGPLKNELEQLTKELKISIFVEFLGPLDQADILDIYKKSHIFLLPSVTAQNQDREGQGLVLQEAQATGLPVISTLHNGIPDGVLDGKSGFLVPEKEPQALAQKLEYLIENPDKWPQMGKTGSDFVKSNYNMNILNKKLVEIYDQALKTPKNRVQKQR